MNKRQLALYAQQEGVTASYSGGTNTAYIKGDDAKVKRFIRLVCLKGQRSYKIAQAK